jgi:hypothetical protein
LICETQITMPFCGCHAQRRYLKEAKKSNCWSIKLIDWTSRFVTRYIWRNISIWLAYKAFKFEKQSKKLKNAMWWNKVKCTIIIVSVSSVSAFFHSVGQAVTRVNWNRSLYI